MTFLSMIIAVIVIGGLLAYSGSLTRRKPDEYFEDNNGGGRPNQPTLDTEFVSRHWQEIQQMTKGGGASLKNSLIEADKLLDYVMLAKGFQGENMGDRLKRNGGKFSDLNGIWSAHKLRNTYAHEVHIDVVPREVHAAIDKLGRGIQDLGLKL